MPFAYDNGYRQVLHEGPNILGGPLSKPSISHGQMLRFRSNIALTNINNRKKRNEQL